MAAGATTPTALPGERIVYEDNHLLGFNKQCGEISQGDRTGDSTVGDLVASHLKRRDRKPGNVYLVPVHRLDRPVSGVILFAKTQKANSRMNALFREEAVTKTYWAVVATPPDAESGRLVHFLIRDKSSNKSIATPFEKPGARRAELTYRMVARSDRYTLLSVEMKTGRHHQVRAQLAAVGSPIRGDLKYGYPRSNPDGGISLHAFSVGFTHPVKRVEVKVTAPLPRDTLWDFFYSESIAGSARDST